MQIKANKYDEQLGNLIRDRRKKLNFTQGQLANKLGLTNPVFVSLIEKSKSRLPVAMINTVSQELKIPKAQIVRLMVKSTEFNILKEVN